jgi:energy-coupling factor transporter ATP-binding protein EcfA2
MAEASKATQRSGDCARFKVPDAGCPNYESFTEYVDGRPLMDAYCAACSDFHEVRKARDKKTKKQMKDSGITADGCFEAIYHNGKPCFLVENGESFKIVESLEIDGQVSYPKEQRSIPYESYGFYEATVPNREELFWKVRNEFQSFIDVESIWKEVLASFVLLSYQQEKLQTVPYIFLYGDNESGKSTVLQLMNLLCYRPLYGVTIPAADIYGFLEDSDSVGIVLEDEIQGIHKDVDKIKIYKAGYKRGASVPRTIITQHDRIIKYYQTFCLKACASEQLPTVKGFRERFLEIPMVEGSPEKEWSDITKEDFERLRNLRNTLLKWKMLSREWDLPNVELKMKGRLKELWKPILQVTSGLTVHDGLFKFVEDQRKERLSVKQDTLEGKIVKVVTELFNESKAESSLIYTIPFQTIWSRLQEELDGKIDDKKPNVMDTSEFFQVTKNKVGYRLREVLSAKSKAMREKDSEGNDMVVKAYEFYIDKLGRIAKKYGYDFVTKLSLLPSSEGVQALESMEKTTPDNVEKEAHTPQQLGYVRNFVTSEKEPLIPTLEDSTMTNITKNSKYENTVGEKDSNSVTPTPQKLGKLSNSVTSVQEALEFVRNRFVEGTQEEWAAFAVEAGLPEKESEALFESLKGSELFWLDRLDGKTVWRWVSAS